MVYAGIVLASVAMIRELSAGWWVVAALLFMPRWLFLLPMIPLAIGAARARRSVIFAMVLADALLVVGPLMGFQVPSLRWFSKAQTGPRVRVLTLNRGGATIDTALFLHYLDRHRIDVVCFQGQDRNSGFEKVLIEAGWLFNASHQLASRFAIVKDLGVSTERDFTIPMTLDRVKIHHPEGFDFVVGSVHLPASEQAFSRLSAGDFPGFRINMARWDDELVMLREWMADSGSTPLIVAGDFQMPTDYHAMASLRASYPSAFEQAGWGTGPTWPTAFPWAGFDQIVATPDWLFTRAWVGPDLGSSHLPMIVEAFLDRSQTGGSSGR
jgi:vancomycin resistance protein VanJ